MEKQKPKTLFDLATDDGPMQKGMTLEEALAQVEQTGGDDELKQIIISAYAAHQKVEEDK